MDKRKGQFHTFRGYQLLKQERNQLTPSMEDYLEMIYRAHIKDGYIRINQLAELLNDFLECNPDILKSFQEFKKSREAL